MNAIVRLASLDDLPEIVTLMKDHASYERADFTAHGLASRLRKAMKGCNPRLTVFLLEVDKAVVGYCSVAMEFSSWKARDYLHMDCLFIRADMRGGNLGKLLFSYVRRFAEELNIEEVQWQTPDWNDSAIQFYERIGAKHSAKRRFHYKVL